jgi:hypothetical protein
MPEDWPRSHRTSRLRHGLIVTGRSRGLRVIILAPPCQSKKPQWHIEQALTGHSCGYSPGLRSELRFRVPFSSHSWEPDTLSPDKRGHRRQARLFCTVPARGRLLAIRNCGTDGGRKGRKCRAGAVAKPEVLQPGISKRTNIALGIFRLTCTGQYVIQDLSKKRTARRGLGRGCEISRRAGWYKSSGGQLPQCGHG